MTLVADRLKELPQSCRDLATYPLPVVGRFQVLHTQRLCIPMCALGTNRQTIDFRIHRAEYVHHFISHTRKLLSEVNELPAGEEWIVLPRKYFLRNLPRTFGRLTHRSHTSWGLIDSVARLVKSLDDRRKSMGARWRAHHAC